MRDPEVPYARDLDVALVQLNAEQERQRLEAKGAEYAEIFLWQHARPIRVREIKYGDR